jgi:hypothetical protein
MTQPRTGPASPEPERAARPSQPRSAQTPQQSPGRPATDERDNRPTRLIRNEPTTEIPMRLLFREDAAGAPGFVATLTPGGRDGDGAAGTSASVPAVRPGKGGRSRDAAGTSRTAVAVEPADRPGAERATELVRSPAAGARTVPVTGSAPDERLARALPGMVAVVAGLAGLAGATVALWWAGALPSAAVDLLGLPAYGTDAGLLGTWLDAVTSRSGETAAGSGVVRVGHWVLPALFGALAVLAFGGLTRGRVGQARVLSLFGRYRGSVRRTGLMWVNPMLLRRPVDVRLRHWRSEPMPAVDAHGVALRVVVQVVWRVRDTARAVLAVEDHQAYLRQCVETAVARVLSQLPADAFHEDAPTLRNAEAVGDELTRRIVADTESVGLEVFSAQPTQIEYAPEVAAAMHRRRVAAIDAKHRDAVLTTVVDSVADMVSRLTARGLVELDDYERRALVKDLTVAFYTGQGPQPPS